MDRGQPRPAQHPVHSHPELHPPQTAFHAHWLISPSPEGAEEFLQAFPGLAIAHRIERLEHERRELAAKTETRVAWGGFDLGKFPAEQRRNIGGSSRLTRSSKDWLGRSQS